MEDDSDYWDDHVPFVDDAYYEDCEEGLYDTEPHYNYEEPIFEEHYE